MRKIVLISMFALMAVSVTNANDYDWKVGNDPANFPVIAGYTAVTTVNGLTIVPKNPMEGTIPANMGQIEASEKSLDGVDYINRFKFNGAGYSGAAATDAAPTVNMPTQRYLQFDVTDAVTVSIVGVSGSSGSDRKIFLTDGANLIGAFDYPGDGALYERTIDYSGGAATLYLFCNAAVNIYHITVTGTTGISTVNNATKEVKSFEYYDFTGRRTTEATKGLVIEKTIYTDGTSSSKKLIKLQK